MVTFTKPMFTLAEIIEAVEDELAEATDRYGPFHSTHEGYAVLKEEVDEMWDAIKQNDINHSRKEAVQVAAVAIRYLIDIKQRH